VAAYRIVSIQRASHGARGVQYYVQKKAMAARAAASQALGGSTAPVEDPGPNEQHLWHGTCGDNAQLILENGFNRTFSSTQAYGSGVYFARTAAYSASPQYACPDPATKAQTLILAKVR
jgi:hypothetical protein